MGIGKTLAGLLNQKGMKVTELSELSGVSKNTIYGMIKRDNMKASFDSLLKICKVLNVDPEIFYNEYVRTISDNIPGAIPIDSDIISFKIVGKVAAGYNCAAVEEYTGDSVEIPLSMLRGYDPSQCFALLVKGNSMYPKMLDGDIALVYKCDSVDSGTTAVILYNGDEATIKKVKYVYGEDWLELIPANPEYETKRIEGTDLEQCHVLGKVIKLIRDI